VERFHEHGARKKQKKMKEGGGKKKREITFREIGKGWSTKKTSISGEDKRVGEKQKIIFEGKTLSWGRMGEETSQTKF